MAKVTIVKAPKKKYQSGGKTTSKYTTFDTIPSNLWTTTGLGGESFNPIEREDQSKPLFEGRYKFRPYTTDFSTPEQRESFPYIKPVNLNSRSIPASDSLTQAKYKGTLSPYFSGAAAWMGQNQTTALGMQKPVSTPGIGAVNQAPTPTPWTPDLSLAKQNLANLPNGVTKQLDPTSVNNDQQLTGAPNSTLGDSLKWTPSGMSSQSTSTGTNTNIPWTKGEKAGAAIAGAGALTQLGLALQPADKEKFRPNPYAGQIQRNLPQNMDLRPLRASILGQETAARNYVDQNTSSAAVRRANALGLSAQTSGQLTNLGVQEQTFNNQARGARAGIYGQLGESDRRTQLLVDDWNARNKGQRMTNISSAVRDVSTFGTNIANIGTYKAGQGISLALVNSLAKNYNIDSTVLSDLAKRRKPSTQEELIKFAKEEGLI